MTKTISSATPAAQTVVTADQAGGGHKEESAEHDEHGEKTHDEHGDEARRDMGKKPMTSMAKNAMTNTGRKW